MSLTSFHFLQLMHGTPMVNDDCPDMFGVTCQAQAASLKVVSGKDEQEEEHTD